jgi:AcrR family transcriptional regulator
MARAKAPDWQLIEREYRAGQLSVAEISRQAGVSRAAIQKRAKKEGWARDLLPAVQERAREELLRDAAPRGALEEEAVEAAAARTVEVVRQHRVSLGRLNRLANRLMADLEIHLDGKGAAPGWMRARDSVGDVVLRVAQTLGKVVPLERQAFAIGKAEEDKPQTPGSPVPDWRELFARAGISERSDPGAG